MSPKKTKFRKGRRMSSTKKNTKKILPIVYGKLYMTGCIHCENLAPEWEIVKKHLNTVCYDVEAQEQTKLAKFNDIYKPYEPLQPQGGYPTIYKLHKRGGNIVYYQGSRDNVSMLKWIRNR